MYLRTRHWSGNQRTTCRNPTSCQIQQFACHYFVNVVYVSSADISRISSISISHLRLHKSNNTEILHAESKLTYLFHATECPIRLE
jgi:hypothetical protein